MSVQKRYKEEEYRLYSNISIADRIFKVKPMVPNTKELIKIEKSLGN